MPHEVTLIHPAASVRGDASSRWCQEWIETQGWTTRRNELCPYSDGALLAGGNLLFFLESTEAGQPTPEAVPFWLHLQSLNPGALQGLRFAICSVSTLSARQPCPFGNACQAKFRHLGATPLAPLCPARPLLPGLKVWLHSVLARISPSTHPVKFPVAA